VRWSTGSCSAASLPRNRPVSKKGLSRFRPSPSSFSVFDVPSVRRVFRFAGAEHGTLRAAGCRRLQHLLRLAGGWRKGAYIPACVRAYPFILVERGDAAGTLRLGVDLDADGLSTTDGAALFDRGKPAAGLNDAPGFCKAYRDNLAATRGFVAALVAADLLEERSATVTLDGGGFTRLDGFLQVSAERFRALDDATWLDWRRRGWIDAVYAHLHSAGRWAQLVEADREHT